MTYAPLLVYSSGSELMLHIFADVINSSANYNVNTIFVVPLISPCNFLTWTLVWLIAASFLRHSETHLNTFHEHAVSITEFPVDCLAECPVSLNEKIKPPLFATISHCVFIIHVSYWMFRLYISHLQVYHV
jgi:hypothetical protein